MNWRWIDNDVSLHEVVNLARQQPAVAMDTEFVRERTFYPHVALFQLCVGEVSFLIDPLKITDPTPLRDLFEDTNTIKVFHSCAEDLEVLNNWVGKIPSPVFDTQIAASLLGMGFMFGYSNLVAEMCAVELNKTETRSNWLQRPLTDNQVKYAVQDVYYLDKLWQKLLKKSELEGKKDWILFDGEMLIEDIKNAHQQEHLKISGGRNLSSLKLNGLHSLSRWREDKAKKKDLPRRWIIDDKTCLRLIEAFPCSSDDLMKLEGIPDKVKTKYGKEIIDIFKECPINTDTELPHLISTPLNADSRKQVKSLKNLIREIAQELGTVPEVLIKSRDYVLLLDIFNKSNSELPGYWSGWREQLVIQPLKSHLSNLLKKEY